MSDASYTALQASVRKFGFKSFILVTPGTEPNTFEVIDGHHRWRAAEDAGMATVPVVVIGRDEADTTALDLAMLSFNVTADILPEVYLDMLRELDEKVGAATLAELTGMDPKFLEDLNRTMALPEDFDLGGKANAADGSRGAAMPVLLPNTDEVRGLLQRAMERYSVKTAGEAVVLALKECEGHVAMREVSKDAH